MDTTTTTTGQDRGRCLHGLQPAWCAACNRRPAPAAVTKQSQNERIAAALLVLFNEKPQWGSAEMCERLQADNVPAFWQFSQGVHHLRKTGYDIKTLRLSGNSFAYRLVLTA